MQRWTLLFVLIAGCTKVGTGHEPTSGETAPAPRLVPAVAPIPAKVTPAKGPARIELTAVTLADDCGGVAPSHSPAKRTDIVEDTPSKHKSEAKRDAASARAQRRCEQTSMQLAIFASDASNIQVKSVELFDASGTSLGTLTASKPTRWSDANGVYATWDETVAAGSTNHVSYVLAQPKWDQIGNRWNRTYTLKTVVSVGGVDQTAHKDVTLTAPTTLPPNVKT